MPTSYGFQPGVADAAPDPHEVGELDAAAVRDGVLAVAREHEVVGAQRTRRADLRGLLAEQRRPEAELALALQRGGLGVDAAHDDHVLVQRRELRVIDVGDPGIVEAVLDSFPGGVEELHWIRRRVGVLAGWLF